MLKNRRSRLNSFFSEHDLDAIYVSNLRNVRYLSLFSGTDGALLVLRDRTVFLCDSRYTAQARLETRECEVSECAVRLDAVHQLVRECQVGRLGFEAEHTTVAELQKMAQQLEGVDLIPLGAGVDEIRACKDSVEIEKLEAVAALASDSLTAILQSVKPGVSEAWIALELEIEMRRNGAEGRAFDFIVASGLRGAMPHGRASDKQIKAGEMVTIDFGAVLDGYHSDETVTVACGTVGGREEEIHAVVKEAHDRAIRAVKPGLGMRALDSVARDYIRDSGYADYFGHGLGHGVGLDIHEKPTISPRGDGVVQEGMVLTIEPGIYIPGFGGVRIEDTVVVTADGCRVLTRADKRLIVV